MGEAAGIGEAPLMGSNATYRKARRLALPRANPAEYGLGPPELGGGGTADTGVDPTLPWEFPEEGGGGIALPYPTA